MATGVIGLGKLGLPLALTLASADVKVIAWDTDVTARDAITTRKPHIDEPHVADVLHDHGGSIKILPPDEIAHHCDVVFIVVPTPSLPTGEFDANLVEQAIRSLTQHTIIALVSTVSPGTCRRLQAVCSEIGHQLVYTPTLIALGSVMHDLSHPQLQLIGSSIESGSVAARRVADVLRHITRTTHPQCMMSYESAEIAKLAVNVFVTLKIGFANTLGQLAQKYGADVDRITGAIGVDQRIGEKSLTAGAGFGGPCFPRDGNAFRAAGGFLGAVTHGINEGHIDWIMNQILLHLPMQPPVEFTYCVHGRAYKEGSNYRIESFGDRLAKELSRHATAASSRDADVVVIAQPLRELNLCDLVKPGALVVDLWRTHAYMKDCPVVYMPFGRKIHHGS